jgi:hypothetical protein
MTVRSTLFLPLFLFLSLFVTRIASGQETLLGVTGGVHLGRWTRVEMGGAIMFRGSTERLGAHTFKASAIVEPDHGVVGGEIGWWADASFCGGLNLGYFVSDSRNATVFRLDVGLSLGAYRVVYGWNFYTAPR